MINRSNYETFLIDYLDGNLSPLEVAELLLFLEQNPELKNEFEGVESIHIPSETIPHFPEKDKLKRKQKQRFDKSKIQDLLIRKVEKQLTLLEEAQLMEIMKLDIALQSELVRYEKTILSPDLFLVFPNKEALKKRTKVIPLWFYYSSIAAAFLLLFLLPFLMHRNQNQTAQKMGIGNQIKTTLTRKEQSFSKPGKRIDLPALKNGSPMPRLRPENASLQVQKKEMDFAEMQSLESTDPKEEIKVNEYQSLAFQTQEEELKDSIAVTKGVVESAPNSDGYVSLKTLVSKRIKDLSKSNLEETTASETTVKSEKISIWDIASISARILSKASGKSIKLKKHYNQEGELKQYAIVSDKFEFSRSR